ncbi:glycosyltransferase family 2 protein [Hyphomonas sp.]|uniref:glycosyltransferase family 2 protein n=1 Tax=Hyphomonas sp. TaxID=87 RepID=UPI003528CD5E
MKVNVCVCTFRRPMVETTLRSLDAQRVPDGVTFDIIVADNDETASARRLVEAFAATANHTVSYIHAPARNISVARNACLDAADGDWVAFVDDDETADDGWLAAFLHAADDGGFDAVFGPVIVDYPEDAPAWMKETDIHSTYPRYSRGQIMTGHSGNCLMRRGAPAIAAQRFLLDKGRTGGEDTEFFARLRERGAKLGAAPEAIVREALPAERISYKWLERRWLRAGITRGRHVERAEGALARLVALPVQTAKWLTCIGLILLTLPWPARHNMWRLRAAYYRGMALSVLNAREEELY